jgi:hypothetical protein
MKKLFTFIFCFTIGMAGFAQTVSAFKTNPSNIPTFTITNGCVLSEVSSPGNSISFKVLLVNTTSTTHTYTVRRTILYNSPVLDVSGGTVTPQSYFCFGTTCFPDNVNNPTSADYTILGPSGSTVTPYDNSYNNGTPFVIYISEAATMGKYFIRYKLQEVSNPNDTLSFTVRYNEFLGVNELASTIESVDVYPNPSNNNASVAVDMKTENDVKIQVFNSLGSLVYVAPSQKYTVGKHKFSIDCTSFNSGLYFISVTAGENKITKRFILNK